MARLCPCCRQPIREVTELDEKHRFFRYQNQTVILTRLEVRFMKLLLTKPGELFTFEEIIDYAWSKDEQNEAKMSLQSVRNIAFKLNTKLRGKGLIIRSKARFGYRLVESAAQLPFRNSSRQAAVV